MDGPQHGSDCRPSYYLYVRTLRTLHTTSSTMSHFRTLLTMLLLAAASLCQAQTQPVDSILSYLSHAMRFSKVTPQEKVYLHFDNTGYFKGEHIWFKAYVTRAAADATSGLSGYLPTELSKVLYVELVSPSGDVVEKRKLPVKDGLAYGDFKLDSILGNGFYEVRAFTRYMTNFGQGGEFSRVFPIFERPQQEGRYDNPRIDRQSYKNRLPDMRKDTKTDVGGAATVEVKKGLSVKFFPEGGDLVRGLTSRVAYTINDPERGELERGITEVTPTGQNIPFHYKDADGKEQSVNFPTARPEGCVLRFNTMGDEEITAEVSASEGMQGRLLAYAMLHNGNVMSCDTFTAGPRFTKRFQRYSLPAGVNQFTVFDASGQIQCERLFFIMPLLSEGDTISVANHTNELKPFGAVDLTLRTQPGASLSFSAMDAGSMTGGKQGDIRTWMLLSSDLKGYIENPDYYFEADDPTHREAADLLMMIQGWRRYDWQLIEGSKTFPQPTQPIEDKLYIYGRIKPALSKWIKKNPVGGVDLTAILFNKSGQSLRGETVTDSIGNYAFELPEINGEWNLQINTRIDDKLKTYTVAIDRHFSPAAREIYPEESQLVEKNEPNLFRRSKELRAADEAERKHEQLVFQTGNLLYTTKAVTIKSKRSYWTDYDGGWYNESRGRYKAQLYYDADAASDQIADMGETQPTVYAWLEAHNNLFKGGDVVMHAADQFLGGNTNGATYTPDGDTLPASFNFHTDGPSYDGRPTIWILNNKFAGATGVTVAQLLGTTDSSQILKISGASEVLETNIQPMPTFLDEVKSIYISEDPSVFGSYLSQSTLKSNNPVTIFLYTHPTYTTASNKGLRRTHFDGFNVPSTFEMDDYTVLPPMEDYRRTLFWAPDVKADAKGEAQLRFFNNGTCREIYLSIEGMTKSGEWLTN